MAHTCENCGKTCSCIDFERETNVEVIVVDEPEMKIKLHPLPMLDVEIPHESPNNRSGRRGNKFKNKKPWKRS